MQALDFYILFPILLPIHVASSFSQSSFPCSILCVMYMCLLVHLKNRCCCSVSSLFHPLFESALNELGPQWFDQRVPEVMPSLLLHWDLHVCQESKLRTSCLHASIPSWAFDDVRYLSVWALTFGKLRNVLYHLSYL